MQSNSMCCHHLLHGSAWESSGTVCPELRSSLLSSQNSLKASNRKKKRTSFKRKASKRGTEVSVVSGSWSNEIHPPFHSLPQLVVLLYLPPLFAPSLYSNHAGTLSILKNVTSATSQNICTVHGSIIPKMIKMKRRANPSRILRLYRIKPKAWLNSQQIIA